MGQYWIPVNLDKKEFVDPHTLGCGLKLWEQLANHPGTATALIILLAAMPEPRGGGDLDNAGESSEFIGRWAGDRIAFVGDYAEDADLDAEHVAGSIYSECSEDGSYTDISEEIAAIIEAELEGTFSDTPGWRSWTYDRDDH